MGISWLQIETADANAEMNDMVKKSFIRKYLVLFYLLAAYKFFSGLWLFQNTPMVFNSRPDITSWLFMLTGIPKSLMHQETACFLADLLFYSAPALLLWRSNHKGFSFLIGCILLLINWMYVLSYTIFPINSIEMHIAWLLMPLLFITVTLQQFYFVLHGLRYYFLFFFASAGCWKLMSGGIFEPLQMSGILLEQHKEILTEGASNRLTDLYLLLIHHPIIGYILYLTATLLELSFLLGFFTKKYDKLLLFFFILFIVMDFLIMRISYFEILCLGLPLLYSRYSDPEQ